VVLPSERLSRAAQIIVRRSRRGTFPNTGPGRGHFPNEQAALKVLYSVATQQRKNRQDMSGKINGWKHIVNTLTVHYGDRIEANSIN
jgi:hypothetical protein